MAGIPPLIGFFGKQSVLLSAIGSGYFFMSLVAILVSVISASYYLRIIRELHSDSEEKRFSIGSILKLKEDQSHRLGINSSIKRAYIKNDNDSSGFRSSSLASASLDGAPMTHTYLSLTNTHAFIIASLTLSIIFYVLKPSILLNSAVLSTLSLFYF